MIRNTEIREMKGSGQTKQHSTAGTPSFDPDEPTDRPAKPNSRPEPAPCCSRQTARSYPGEVVGETDRGGYVCGEVEEARKWVGGPDQR